MCMFFVLHVEELQKCFLKTRVVRNSCSKGNIDGSKTVLAETVTQVTIEIRALPLAENGVIFRFIKKKLRYYARSDWSTELLNLCSIVPINHGSRSMAALGEN